LPVTVEGLRQFAIKANRVLSAKIKHFREKKTSGKSEFANCANLLLTAGGFFFERILNQAITNHRFARNLNAEFSPQLLI